MRIRGLGTPLVKEFNLEPRPAQGIIPINTDLTLSSFFDVQRRNHDMSSIEQIIFRYLD